MNRKGLTKLNTIKSIEVVKQAEWDELKLFEACPDYSSEEKNKHFVSFPYPYMNGNLHLGHAFSLSKCEFSMGFERLKGKNTMWGFGLHCTGMPIKASADKLQREMKTFGYPPVFPDTETESKEEASDIIILMDKSKGKKSKATAKSGGFKYQWQIMRSNGMTDEEILQFTATNHWIEYYPPLTIEHMKRMGIKVDWRRSFITTDANPFYDSFVRWQFLKLRKANKIAFGKRQTIFSPADNQPCMDHDRSTGEGVGPQDYTLIKLEVLRPLPHCLEAAGDSVVYLVAATMRPETMYGQTNCWVHPDIEYVAVRSANHGVLVCVERAARNMSYQELLTGTPGQLPIVSRFRGSQMIGCALRAPLGSYETVYALPMLTIKANKGTGVVTSVPSDSPDDFAALRDLKQKEALRKKYGIDEHQVMPFEPVAVLETAEYGPMCAPRCVEEMKIQSQNDTDKLAEAKEKCYKLGFYSGRMLVGEHAGLAVQRAKELIQARLIADGDAIKYAEPERAVTSRSGDDCVVALCDQWFLNYRDPDWKQLTRTCLAGVNTFGDEVRRNFEATLENLHEYACSRSYGLGSRLPWDEQYLVESLSDSTVYMAYYTVAHALQGNTLDGHCGAANLAGISASEMTPDAWEFVLGDDEAPASSIDEQLATKLSALRREFRYWYPLDLRVSGKDLVPNHLTYCLYNHCALWPDRAAECWPRAIRANGHLLLNNEKMSKSTGNFLTVADAIDKFSADGMRLAIADAGDSIEDANFVEDVADAGLLRLHVFLEWTREMVSSGAIGRMRSGPLTLHCDAVFDNAISRAVADCERHYREMMFKRVVQVGFHELQTARDRYRETCLGNHHGGLVTRFIEVQCLLLSPICPHVTDYIWTDVLGKPRSILLERWPAAPAVDERLSTEEAYLDGIAHDFRKQLLQRQSAPRLKNEPHNAAVIWVARRFPQWQESVLDALVELSDAEGRLPDNKMLNKRLRELPQLQKPAQRMKKAMDLVQMVRAKADERAENVARMKTPQIDERAVIERNIVYMERTLGLAMGHLELRYSEESADEKLFDSCCPMEPKITFFWKQPSLQSRRIVAVNPDLFSGLVSHDIEVHDGDSVAIVARRIAEQSALEEFSAIELYRYIDLRTGWGTIPSSTNRMANLTRIDSASRFVVTANCSGIQLQIGDAIVDIGEKIKYVLN